ncbi:unannotated protein [freshwater metagenome]|uniref:Unannotated protein n=1 Tax=freshwater metagenome TaxID=449393 RepID=A0A6J7KQ04_9ZZZZ
MGQLEPSASKRVGQLLRVLEEPARDGLVNGVHPQRHVGGEHHRRVPLRGVLRVGNSISCRATTRDPLLGASRTPGQFPLVAEQGLEVAVVPGGRRGRPGTLESAGDGVGAASATEGVLPAQAHLLQRSALGLRTDVGRVACAVGFAEGVAAGDECDGLFIIHRHASKRLADVAGRSQRIGHSVGALGVDVDETHLHGRERVLKVTVTGVAGVAQPLELRAPVRRVGLPHVSASASEAEGGQSHRFDGHVARKDHQVGPRQAVPVLLLDRPQQSAGLVEVPVVGPTVERCEALHARAAPAAAVGGAVGASTVPRHTDEEGAVVAVVGGPPVLGVGHQRGEVGLDLAQVEASELARIVEARAHGVGQRRVLVQQPQVELLGPPVAILGSSGLRAVQNRAACGVVHDGLLRHWAKRAGHHCIPECFRLPDAPYLSP